MIHRQGPPLIRWLHLHAPHLPRCSTLVLKRTAPMLCSYYGIAPTDGFLSQAELHAQTFGSLDAEVRCFFKYSHDPKPVELLWCSDGKAQALLK